jgi:hypothetical protein
VHRAGCGMQQQLIEFGNEFEFADDVRFRVG